MNRAMTAPSPPSASPASGPPAAVASPCVKVCVVDGESGLCLGCLRTLSEVAAWPRLSDAQRAAILAQLPGRPARISPEKRAMFGIS